MKLTSEINIELKQVISAMEIQSLEILSMTIDQLINFMENEFLENPLLDFSEIKNNNSGGSQLEDIKDIQYENLIDKEKFEISLKEYLLSQLDYKTIGKTKWKIIQYLIDDLDDRGYFNNSITSVSKILNVNGSEVNECLDILKKLEPYGIFATDIEECLIIQLKEKGLYNEILDRMIKENLSDISKGKISSISRNLKISTLEVRKNIAIIEKLIPYPASEFIREKTIYINPDIIVSRKDNKWEIELNDNWVRNYCLNDYYLKMIQNSKDNVLVEYFTEKQKRINMIFENIEKRRNTLQNITIVILELQEEFFLNKGQIKPMSMDKVASILGIHTSTVSRAIKGKNLQYKAGVIGLRSLFSVFISDGVSLAQSSFEIKNRIRNLISEEDKYNPLSDMAIANKLEEEGIHASRRVIAKYREELGIKGSFSRKI